MRRLVHSLGPRRLPAAVAVVLAAAAPVAAQDQASPVPADEAPDIVVTGRVDHGWEEVTRQAREISRDGNLRHAPLARFEERICPGVAGLTTEAAEMIVYRLRQIAGEIGIPQAAAGACTPNIVIAFTEDGRADLAELQRRDRLLSSVLSVSEQRELLEEPGPVRVFSIVETRMLNGMPLTGSRSNGAIPTGAMHAAHSRIYTAIRRDIVAATVLFDREEARGKTLWQLADYAAMRVFARTRAPDEAEVESILTLFDRSGAAPDGLTAFDLAYLQSLYAGIPNLRGMTKIAGVDGKLRRQAEAEE